MSPLFRRPLPLLALLAALGALGPAPALQAETQGAVTAPVPADVGALMEAMHMADLFEVMSAEGIAYGTSLEADMLGGRGGPRFAATVAAIYEAPKLQAEFAAALSAALAGDRETLSAATAFFAGDPGREIVKLEIEARRALLDEAVEEAAQVEAERMQAERDPKLRLLRDLAEAGDLIEMNVAGALSSNLAFFKGMASVEGAAFNQSDEDMMSEVWSQEESIRNETGKWLYSYMALAYQPLPDADLSAYVAFSESPAGQRLNAALFQAFDVVFGRVSYDLGRATAQVLVGSDI